MESKNIEIISKLTFHYGAIKPNSTNISLTSSFLLTFHYGAIEPYINSVLINSFIALTFHYGAIEP